MGVSVYKRKFTERVESEERELKIKDWYRVVKADTIPELVEEMCKQKAMGYSAGATISFIDKQYIVLMHTYDL